MKIFDKVFLTFELIQFFSCDLNTQMKMEVGGLAWDDHHFEGTLFLLCFSITKICIQVEIFIEVSVEP